MKATFEAYLPELWKHEGGYVDHPADPGGATNLGITLATLQGWRGKPVTKADVRKLTKGEAAEIYRARYWNAIDADDLPAGLDALAFDIAVNHGVGRWLQWASLARGVSPVAAIKLVSERRRKFYRSLKTFKTFGKGWMARADQVEAWAIKRAAAAPASSISGNKVTSGLQGIAFPFPPDVPAPEPEAKPAEPFWKRSPILRSIGQGAAWLGAGGSALLAADWRVIAVLSVVGLALAFMALRYQVRAK